MQLVLQLLSADRSFNHFGNFMRTWKKVFDNFLSKSYHSKEKNWSIKRPDIPAQGTIMQCHNKTVCFSDIFWYLCHVWENNDCTVWVKSMVDLLIASPTEKSDLFFWLVAPSWTMSIFHCILKLVAKKLYLSYQKNSISMFFLKKLIKWVYHDLIWFYLSKLISSFLNYILGVTWSSCSKNNITSTEFTACIFFHKGLIFDFVQTQVSFILFYSWSVNVSCSYSADISSSVK